MGNRDEQNTALWHPPVLYCQCWHTVFQHRNGTRDSQCTVPGCGCPEFGIRAQYQAARPSTETAQEVAT